MSRHKPCLIPLFALLCLSLAAAFAAEDRAPHVLASIWENDLLFNPLPRQHQDRHYTQGLKVIYLDRGEPVPGWAHGLGLDKLTRCLPLAWIDPAATNFGVAFGQNIFTPEDNRSTNVIASDRPYAGWLYAGLAIQRRGLTPGGRPVLESWELNLGVIGPEAQGEWAQNTVHQWRHIPTFEGWENQLRTEPAFVLKYGRAWRWAINEGSARYFDVIPHCGVNLGTLMTAGEVGVAMRLGVNLPDDFGVQRIDSDIVLAGGKTRGWFGAYLFGEVNGRAVGRNAFLDGNLYQSSHHVDKRPLVADMIWGLAATFGRHCELSWTVISRTREFDNQTGFDEFGSLAGKLTWAF